MRKIKIALIVALLTALAGLGIGHSPVYACPPQPPPPGVPPTSC